MDETPDKWMDTGTDPGQKRTSGTLYNDDECYYTVNRETS